MSPIVVILVVVAAAVIVIVGIYNKLVSGRNQVKNAFSQIDVQLKRRYDLIPNLIETAKAYLKHERTTLEAVITARNSAFSARQKAAGDPTDSGAMKALVGAETALNGMLGKFFALAESYPDLKANQTMMQLSEELTSTENKVAFARQAYNDSVMTYNISREKFPAVLFSEMMGFKEAVLFEIQAVEERQAPKVSFS